MQNAASLPGTANSSRKGRRFGWYLNRGTPGRAVIIFTALVALIVLFYAEEDWRGKRDWEVYKRKMEAEGVETNWYKFVPPPVPDGQNFAMTPLLAPLFDFNSRPLRPGESPWRDPDACARAQNFATAFSTTNELLRADSFPAGGQLTDLEEALFLLQKHTNSDAVKRSFSTRAEAATVVMSAWEEFKPVLDELRTASRRPYCRFNINYDEENPMAMLVPHIGPLRRASQVLQIRASVELALGKTEAAFDDAGLMLYLAEAFHDEPLLISHAVRLVMLHSVQQIVWEGMAEHRWSDTQLRDFQAQLQKITPLKDLSRPRLAERAAFGIKFFEFIRSHPNAFREMLAQNDDSFWASALLAAPAGWLYQEQISCQRLYSQNILPFYDPQTGQIHPGLIEISFRRPGQKGTGSFSSFTHHTVFSKMIFPDLLKISQKSAAVQTGMDQAVLACALERFRATNGRFPETLVALAPRFIDKTPVDVCSGQPYKYRLADDGRYMLYSVGWNEKDDGGTVVKERGGQGIDPNQGDWVWPQYPEK